MATAHSIMIWTVAVDSIPDPLWPDLAGLLNGGERARATRFTFERNQRQYTAAHALKRLALSAVGSATPHSWAFEETPGGKPRVCGWSGPYFNLSHCRGRVACAVSTDLELGIDVENVSQHAPLELAERYFAEEEGRWLRDLPQRQQSLGFFRLWTLKEAFVKATGRGLAESLQNFAVSFEPLCVTFHNPELGDANAWRFDQRLLAGEHLMALAWRVDTQEATVSVTEMRFERLLG